MDLNVERKFDSFYNIPKVSLKRVEEVKDFIVLFETELTFENHINNTIKILLKC